MKPLSTAAIGALNEVLLQAALRFERSNHHRIADERAREIAQRQDRIAAEEMAAN